MEYIKEKGQKNRFVVIRKFEVKHQRRKFFYLPMIQIDIQNPVLFTAGLIKDIRLGINSRTDGN